MAIVQTPGAFEGLVEPAVRVRRPTWTYPKWAALRVAIYERDDYACQVCGWRPSKVPVGYDGRLNVPADRVEVVRAHGRLDWMFECIEIDHFLPTSRGGTNDPSNLRTLCSTCNRRKFTKTPEVGV